LRSLHPDRSATIRSRMAQVVVVRRNPKEQARLTAMVANGVRKLLNQDVLLVELGVHHVDVPEELAKQKLKVKYRMDGITYWKSTASKAAMTGDKHLRIGLDTAEHAVFEGGETLDFELCKARCCLRSSSMVAKCNIPLKEVMRHSAEADGCPACVWDLDLLAADASKKVLGRLVINARIRTVKLHAAGGLEALKANALPRPPTSLGTASAVELDHNVVACEASAEKATRAQLRLQEAIDGVMALAGPASVSLQKNP